MIQHWDAPPEREASNNRLPKPAIPAIHHLVVWQDRPAKETILRRRKPSAMQWHWLRVYNATSVGAVNLAQRLQV
jgi:hypothetical protein